MLLCSCKKTITSYPGNIEHSQAIMSLLTDLPYYEIKSSQNLKKYGDPIGQNKLEH